MYKQEPLMVLQICLRLLRFFYGSGVFQAVKENTFRKGFIFWIFFLNLTAAFHVFSKLLGCPNYFMIQSYNLWLELPAYIISDKHLQIIFHLGKLLKIVLNHFRTCYCCYQTISETDPNSYFDFGKLLTNGLDSKILAVC